MFQFINQVPGRVARQQFVGMATHNFLQVRGQHGGRVHRRVAQHFRPITHALLDPHGRLLERWVARLLARHDAGRHARIHRQ